MTEEELQEVRRATRRLVAERGQERIMKSLTGLRNALNELYRAPEALTKAAMRLGMSNEMIDQVVETLLKVKDQNAGIKGEVLSTSFHLAEESLGVSEATQEMANVLTPMLAERTYLEADPKSLVAVFRAVTVENWTEARELLKQVEPAKYSALFGDSGENLTS